MHDDSGTPDYTSEFGRKLVAEANREAWNRVTCNHRQAQEAELLKKLQAGKGHCLSDTDWQYFNRIGVVGKRIAHIACNKGDELLSLVQAGASSDSVGFDVSDEAVRYACDLSTQSGIACHFVRGDMYQIDEIEYGSAFDIVYISVGALGWFPDIDGAFKKMAAFLKKGGRLYIHEMHPILDMFKPDSDYDEAAPMEAPTVVDSYFRAQPFVEQGGLDYVSGEKYEASDEYWFHHTLANIIMAGIKAGLSVVQLEEFPIDISHSYSRLEQDARPPLSYALLFKKPNPDLSQQA